VDLLALAVPFFLLATGDLAVASEAIWVGMVLYQIGSLAWLAIIRKNIVKTIE